MGHRASKAAALLPSKRDASPQVCQYRTAPFQSNPISLLVHMSPSFESPQAVPALQARKCDSLPIREAFGCLAHSDQLLPRLEHTSLTPLSSFQRCSSSAWTTNQSYSQTNGSSHPMFWFILAAYKIALPDLCNSSFEPLGKASTLEPSVGQLQGASFEPAQSF